MKSYRDNGGGEFGARHKTVYDDVFGGPPKFGAPTLPPRLEDYTEIFQGFHASRGSSIPVLDLPPASEDSDDIWFDLQTSKLDYSEVFGGFNGLDFAVSYEDLFKKSEVADDDSSDEVWTPAQSESLSDELDPYASLETNQHLSNADLSLNEASSKAHKDISNGMSNGSQFHELVLEDQTLPNKIENEELPSKANMYHCVSKEIGGVGEGKRLKKALSQPADSKPLYSVSDISLKTQPSQVPPPSRPPPALAKKKGDTGSFGSKLKTSKSYAFERMTGGSSPPYFDVEIDASSSAAASAAAMKDVMEHAHAKLRSAKELMERKKEGLLSRSKLRVGNDVKDDKGREERPKVKTGEKNITQVGNSIERETVKEVKLYKGLDKTKGTVESREETQFHEPFITNQVTDVGMLEPDTKSRVSIENKSLPETFEQQEDVKNEQKEEAYGLVENKEKRETLKKFHREDEHLKKPSEGQKACEPREREKRSLVGQQHGEIETPSEADEIEFYENLIEIRIKDKNMETEEKLTGVHEKVDAEHQLENATESKGYYMGSVKYDVGLKEVIEQENENIQEETLKQDLKKAPHLGPNDIETIKSKEEKDHELGESERIVEDVLQYIKENEERYVKAVENEESDKVSETVLEQDTDKKKQIYEQNEKIFHDELMLEKEQENVNKQENACEREENELRENHHWEKEEIGKRHTMDSNSEEDRKLHEGYEKEENEEVVIGKDCIQNEPGATKWDDDDDKSLHSNSESHSSIEEENHSEASDGAYQADDDEILQPSGENIEATPLKNWQPRSHAYNEKAEESFCSPALNPNGLLNGKAAVGMGDVTNSNPLNESSGRTHGINVAGQTEMGNSNRTSEIISGLESATNLTHNHGGKRMNVKGVQSGIDPEGRMNISTSPQVAREWVDPLKKTNNRAPNVAGMEKNDEILDKILAEDREKEEKLKRERELETDRLRKIEEERERQREREKDRMAVDTATLEARERAFAEARERAERAAVERATAEFRQRALAEARERLEKACAEARERSLAEKMSEARLRAERVAVEKATAEARERAEKSAVNKFSTSRSSGMRQNSSSSDLPDSQYLNVGTYGGLRYSYTAAHNGGEGESPQRCKARLERHQRTADRAAKALAEKNMRDLIAQKEQAERNRLAEGLDAEVKRWSSGKQGNLRALLSTLQYILGPESGWHPVPLTEVITTAAVKKAYRKATLCVHPDKLQQRGATIHQKYICEKVFDLLKEAWNKFNSEER